MAARVAGMPSLSASRRQTLIAVLTLVLPLWMMARPNSPLGARHRKQRGDAHGAGRLTEDGDLAGIAPESSYVVPHPFECSDLVEEP